MLKGLGWPHTLTVVSTVQTCCIKPICFSNRRLVSSDRQNRGIWFTWRSEAKQETCSCDLATELHCHEVESSSLKCYPCFFQFIDSSGLFSQYWMFIDAIFSLSQKLMLWFCFFFLKNNENIKNLKIMGSLKRRAGQMLTLEVHLWKTQPVLLTLVSSVPMLTEKGNAALFVPSSDLWLYQLLLQK